MVLPASSKAVFIVGAKRTPFGTFLGKLAGVSQTDMAVHATKAALESAKVSPALVDTVHVGNVIGAGLDSAYLSRHVALKSGCKIETPALTVNRLCGSGFQSVISAAHDILTGDAQISLAAGTESMSGAPHHVYGLRNGLRLGQDATMKDALWGGLTDSYAGSPMAMTAEKLAEMHAITREQCDAFALRSQKNWQESHKSGKFQAEIAPMKVKGRKGEELMTHDEHPRDTTMDQLAKLSPVFKKGGVVTAGNASGVSDGAGAVVVASEEAVKKHHLTPLARIVSYGIAGVDPSIMGIGPVPAIKIALARAKLHLKDIDIIEINEAFAAQFLACQRELGFDMEKANVHGGAIALGHPLAASGSRITANLAHHLHQGKGRYAIGSACIGGGQGIAVIFERI
eukprot:TRINITY_DN8446_c0_g1::TRINITY_DN8446_c0_g1_i1::g.3425::m.3425 TRINITY_DN8446_c0_g1::TRINITY_DN8446_c0_g1_i1::g.3425  ORF type:complete len:399 (-),score=137.13,sp/Q3T0R7/THIM_BOVIN/59.23/2e-166,Thiolase_N/PF00108.18/3.8e-84,Thiolase_C/PF02803.13/3.6e+03,Thiolase_C/PF02803.13/1.6e-47,ketoacyl-synt/PF00109.21/0.33,ketoacyl-synt/PF00109.21/0.011,ketoacyl-synt/PF00109.21/1.4e+03,ketoacyl-synt/PF00109.21/2.6e+03,ACP_syn_III/PF08545.5/91,ACP_syn_III/PF08545.5/5 TRINITY_DN8446_c0_g1_i1:28-1224(-)